MSNRTRRRYTSAGQRKPPPKMAKPPELAGVVWPDSEFLPKLIIVGRPDVCARSDCEAEIAPGESAAYFRESGALYCERCVKALVQAARDLGRTPRR